MSKILIVNDEPDLVDIAQLVLEAAGYDTHTSTEGTRTVELARRYAPDLILLDFVLTKTQGDQVLAALRSEPATHDIPVLMMSALNDGGERARQAGADGFLAKPFTAEDLVAAVGRMVGVGKTGGDRAGFWQQPQP
jgi:CheY-like chemotaxis protein